MKNKASIVVAILLLAVGFAAVSTTLIINGSAKVGENTNDFSVIFTAATLDGQDVYTNVISQDKKTITFETSDLKTLNQTSVLTYEVTNNSANYDVEVQVNCKVKDNAETKYTSIKNELENNATVVKAKNTVGGTLTVTLNKTATEEVKEEYICTLEFNAVERDTIGVELTQFQKDSWSTIASNVKSGNTINYHVGDTKKVTIASHINDCSSLTGYGSIYACVSSVEPEKEVTVRISNMSECTNGETSETACGFVVEFVDIIERHNYNKEDATNEYGTNKGGWKYSELRTYISDTLYNALPNDLQSVIATTKVISSHGESDSANFETEDKLYLLSGREVYEDGDDTDYQISKDDTSYSNTKQLDYYKNQGVTSDSSVGAIKQYNEYNFEWWLRSVFPRTSYSFISVGYEDSWSAASAYYPYGISPVFRIA